MIDHDRGEASHDIELDNRASPGPEEHEDDDWSKSQCIDRLQGVATAFCTPVPALEI